MNLEALAKPAASSLSGRLFLVSTLPTTAATVFLLTLLWAGAPGPVRWRRAWQTAAQLQTGEALLLLLAVSLIAVVTMPLQLPLIRLLEGYWPSRLEWLSTRCRAWQTKRRGPTDVLIDPERTSPADIQRIGQHGEWQRTRFPLEDHLVRPTGLGNVLTAAEARAGRSYGLDAVVVWPRLEPLLGERVRAAVADRRTTMDAAARLSVTAAVCVPPAIWLLWHSGWWLLLAPLLAAVAWLGYVATVHAAIAYGECVTAAFDLHRFELHSALHLPLPADPAEELATNAAISLLWRQGVPLDRALRYQHQGGQPATQSSQSETEEETESETGEEN
ncbi:hypothetical protein [Kitasatospora kifunensis]|uniref:Uncharacterized protein n=1 Tax=Kitasatospora kifunensis TaxID=58351 RepID=A0A7W7VSB7_KITKI|nr:hypothetical protein [Kitasatospora kifunensis]MBB4921016.1 hypothetical protein [Kitasatospora kifunensis]